MRNPKNQKIFIFNFFSCFYRTKPDKVKDEVNIKFNK